MTRGLENGTGIGRHPHLTALTSTNLASTGTMAMEKQRPHKPWCLQGAPLQKGSKEETFAALAATYGLTNEVIDLFLKGPMENLEDFRYYFA